MNIRGNQKVFISACQKLSLTTRQGEKNEKRNSVTISNVDEILEQWIHCQGQTGSTIKKISLALHYLIKLKLYIPYDPAITLPGI